MKTRGKIRKENELKLNFNLLQHLTNDGDREDEITYFCAPFLDLYLKSSYTEHNII